LVRLAQQRHLDGSFRDRDTAVEQGLWAALIVCTGGLVYLVLAGSPGAKTDVSDVAMSVRWVVQWTSVEYERVPAPSLTFRREDY
jgi:hypothetical protein